MSLQVLEAEATRDDEMARLEARHARDKQLISALKLKVERLELELVRAEDVPQHEAETYLDLLGGGGGGGKKSSSAKKTAHSGNQLHEDSNSFTSDGDVTQRELNDNEAEEGSIRALVEEQDALDGTWTKQIMEKEDNRRKLFAKKRKQQ